MNQGEHKRILTRTVLPAVAATRGRFCDVEGEQLTVAGAKAAGVYADDCDATDIAKGDGVTINIVGLEEIESGAAFAEFALLASDASGRGVTATAGKAVNAVALEAATASGQRCLAVLLCSSEPAVASAFVADPAAGATVDAEARAAIASILDILIAQKLMAAS